jgi:hypothetical protein
MHSCRLRFRLRLHGKVTLEWHPQRRSPTPSSSHSTSTQKPRPPKRKIRLTPENELERQSNDVANTAVDLDENGQKLIYQNAKNGPDGEISEKAAGKKIIKLINSNTGRWIRYKETFVPRPQSSIL